MFAGVSIEKVWFRNRYRVGSFCFDEPLIPSPRDVLVSTAGSLGLAFLRPGDLQLLLPITCSAGSCCMCLSTSWFTSSQLWQARLLQFLPNLVLYLMTR
jgi:hypothetical protein